MKANIYIHKLAAIVLMIAIVLTGSGCKKGAPSPEAKDLAILVANTKGREAPNFNDERIQKCILETIESGGSIIVINVDGNPATVKEQSYQLDERYANASRSKLNADITAEARSLLEELQQVQADDPEVDLLKALEQASHFFEGLERKSDKTIMVMDTGLSTAGQLNFCNNLISADPETLASLLEERACIPSLSEVDVEWYLSDAADNQIISNVHFEKLKNIWKAIIERGGGTFEDKSTNTFSSALERAALPDVTVVELPEETPIQFEKTSLKGGDKTFFQTPQVISEEQVQFLPDSSDFADAEKAADTMRPIADYLIKNTDVHLLLIGTIAGDENTAFGNQLSADRAEKVREALIEFGVSPNQLSAKGLGCSDPWHIHGVGTSGEAASKNRKVVLLDASTELAGQL